MSKKVCEPLAEVGVTDPERLDATAFCKVCINCPLPQCIEDKPTRGAYKMLDDIDPTELGIEPSKITRWL